MKRRQNSSRPCGKHARVTCKICSAKMRSDNLRDHLKTHNPSVPCKFCKKDFRTDKLLRHEALCKDGVDERLCDRTEVEQLPDCPDASSVCGFFTSYELKIKRSKDYDVILDETCSTAQTVLKEYLKRTPVKAQIVLGLTFYKDIDAMANNATSEKYFRSICEPLLVGDDLDKFFNRAKVYIRGKIDEYQRYGSGWIFNSSKCAHLELAKYCPLAASGNITIPKKIKDMKSVLNIVSDDDKCFLYCLLGKLYPSKANPKRYTTYLDHIDKIDMCGVDFPIKLDNIQKIEQANQLSISVFEWNTEDQCVDPLRHGCGNGTPIELLYLEEDKKAHFMLIKNFNKFMSHRSKHNGTMFFCLKCMHGFTTEDLLAKHADRCCQGVYQHVSMPPKETTIKFRGESKQEKKMFVMYTDFEATLKKIKECKMNTGKTEFYQEHKACSFSIVTMSEFDDFENETVFFSDPDPDKVTERYVSELLRIHDKMMAHYETKQHPINMSTADEQRFKKSKICHICKQKLEWGSKNNYPVRDHNHTKSENNFRGAACNRCNRNYYERSRKVAVLTHNAKNYDMSFFLLDVIKKSKKVQPIAENLEKFKTLVTEKFVFLDSCQFLTSSLDKLAENLKGKGPQCFKRLQKEFPAKYTSLMDKAVYPYDYMSSYEVFKEPSFPPQSAFFNKLKDEELSDEDYQRGKSLFEEFGCKNMLDYMLLYVKADSLLLCDIFENFRDLCMLYYGLDPCHYFSLPGFGFDAMLKMTGVEIESMTDIDMYTFIENNLRGGVTTINHRQFKANNKYLKDFDDSKPSTFIHYTDSNNLYGLGLSSKMPIKVFRWLTQEEVDDFDVQDTDADGDTCYILEVDLLYPDELHDSHNCYPLAVEKRVIKEHEISDFNKNILKDHKETFKPSQKLCPDFNPKEKYVCSLKNLQFYLEHGLKLTKIHRVLTAYQCAFMEPFIDFNSKKRAAASSKFDQDLFKLMNNSCYGKLIEDLRKRSNVDVVKDERRARKLTSRPQYKSRQILDQEVTLVQSMKGKLTLNKPIACGFIVLEMAKYHMSWYWYEVLKPKYGDEIKLLLSDTDSFIYSVFTEDIYEDLLDLRKHVDLSVYPKDSPYFRPENKKVIGKFSDEKPDHVIKEVIALKPKMYSILAEPLPTSRQKEKKENFITAKGITAAAQKLLTHEDYRSVLVSRKAMNVDVRSIRSFNHKLFTISVNKKGLSAYDDKKFILSNGIDTLSYGHYRINNM